MRSKRVRLLLTVLGLLVLGLFSYERVWAIFASPINGGCYIVAPGQCKIHIDPFVISIANSEHLVFFELRANNNTVYSFRTDNSNPPSGNYSPSVVMQDFAATCGETYTINLVGQDTSNPSAFNLGSVSSVVCPASVP